jgi:hypothetical protein
MVRTMSASCQKTRAVTSLLCVFEHRAKGPASGIETPDAGTHVVVRHPRGCGTEREKNMAATAKYDGKASEQTVQVPTLNLDAELDDASIEKALQTGARTTGGFDGPSWMPQLAPQYNPDKKESFLAEKLLAAGPGSTTRPLLGGKLVAEFAWGRRVYFVDVQTKTRGVVRVKVPESAILYSGLNLVVLGSVVALKYDGKGKAKPGQDAPNLFTVACPDGGALAAPRADALVLESKKEREAKQARAKRVAERRLAALEGDDEDDQIDA